MEFETKEFMIRFLEERIIIMKQKESVSRMTKKGAIECTEKMSELCNINANSKAIISYIESLYIKKDVLRVFSEHPTHKDVYATAMISTSFIAKNMASIVLKMRARFVPDDIPMQIFSTEAEAIEWVHSILDSKP